MKSAMCFLISLLSLVTNAQVITTIAGNGIAGYTGDGGLSNLSELHEPISISIDNLGNIYIAEFFNNVIRKISPVNIISTIAGNGSYGYAGDNGPATNAMFSYPAGVTSDNFGNIYVAEYNGLRIRKINSSGVIITIAGNGSLGSTGDGGPATNAKLNEPSGVAVDRFGNVYIAETGGNRIRKIDPSGIISTFAGTGVGGYSGDFGPATAAQLYFPGSVLVDTFGNVYFTEIVNDVLRMVDTSGIIYTLAGTGTAGYSGDHGPANYAQLNCPGGIAIDSANNIYVADEYNNRIRKIDSSGIITTIAGNGVAGYAGDGGDPFSAKLGNPTSISFDASGNLYIADDHNERVRKIVTSMTPSSSNSVLNENGLVIVCPNPATEKIIISALKDIATLSISNFLGQVVYIHSYNTNKVQIDISNFPSGVYFIRINGTEVRRFVKE